MHIKCFFCRQKKLYSVSVNLCENTLLKIDNILWLIFILSLKERLKFDALRHRFVIYISTGYRHNIYDDKSYNQQPVNVIVSQKSYIIKNLIRHSNVFLYNVLQKKKILLLASHLNFMIYAL